MGILTNLFGDAAEDQEVARVVRAAVDEMEGLGATAVEITISDFDELLEGSGVINIEFGSDLLAYLAATPGVTVGSVADIVETGLFHRALENSLRRNSPVEIDVDEYEARLAKQTTIRDTVVGILDDHLLDALVLQGRSHRRTTAGVHMSTERAVRLAGFDRSRGFYGRWLTCRCRVTRQALQRYPSGRARL